MISKDLNVKAYSPVTIAFLTANEMTISREDAPYVAHIDSMVRLADPDNPEFSTRFARLLLLEFVLPTGPMKFSFPNMVTFTTLRKSIELATGKPVAKSFIERFMPEDAKIGTDRVCTHEPRF